MAAAGGEGDGARYLARAVQSWPSVVQRLGERRAAFEAAVVQRAAGHGLVEVADVARYMNLCLAFGPGFEDKTENEWALAILADERLTPAVKLHQLVRRARTALQRRPADASTLDSVDAGLLDLVDLDRTALRPDALRMPRTACDIEAVEVRLIDTGWRQEYQRGDGSWSRVVVQPPQPLRIAAANPAPSVVHVLTGAPGATDTARLQVRQVAHGRCSLGLHPAVNWLNPAGVQAWVDQDARSAAWPITAGAAPAVSAPRLLAESPPEVTLLELPSCAVRDEGVPFGAQKMQLWAYAAWQWLLTMQRQAPLGFELPEARSAPPAAAPTQIRFECDGTRRPVVDWQQAFDGGLREQLGQGLKRLMEAWQPRASEATLSGEFTLFDGRCTLTWGWREGPKGLASPPLLRAVADIDWAASARLLLQGLVEYAGAKARLYLRVEGQAKVQVLIERLLAEQPLLEALEGARLQWRWPVQLDYDPVAEDSGCVFSEVGPCTGAMVGAIGLRPSATVGGAWEWFATLTLEPVAVRVVVHDPLLGRSESHLALLGSVSLLDWKAN